MSQISWRTDGAVTRLILARPQALNALSEEMSREFATAVRRVAREPSKVVVLEGEGAAFCAGGDLAFIEKNRARPAAALAPLMRRFYGSFLSVRGLPQATIAKVHGAAVGAGLCLALACDLRVVADDARLGFNFVRLGLSPGMAAWPLARAAFGDARARELLFSGRFFSGRDCALWGGGRCARALGRGARRGRGASGALRRGGLVRGSARPEGRDAPRRGPRAVPRARSARSGADLQGLRPPRRPRGRPRAPFSPLLVEDLIEI